MEGDALVQVIFMGESGLMTGLTLSSKTVVVAVLVQPLLVSVKVTVYVPPVVTRGAGLVEPFDHV